MGQAHIWASGLVLAAGLGLALGAWHQARSFHRQEVQRYFAYRNRDARSRIALRLEIYEQILFDVRGLFHTRDQVSHEDFANFLRSTDAIQRFPGSQAIGFSLRIEKENKASISSRIRSQGFKDFTIRPAGERSVYSAVIYIEPFEGRHLRAFGYDMFSEPVRREAMLRAQDTGQVAMSGKVQLIPETQPHAQAGFLVFVPVYRNASATSTLQDRREHLIGWVYAPFRMDDLMHGVFGEGESDLQVELFDSLDAKPESLMYSWNPDP